MTAELGLRERKKQRTRQLLSQTARRLFSERGFEQVSIAEIARQADVSEQTVFNYFPSKEDLVYSRLVTFEEQLFAAIRERGFLAARDEAEAHELIALTRMIAASPALLPREQLIFASYTDTLAQLIAAETSSSTDDPRPFVRQCVDWRPSRTDLLHLRTTRGRCGRSTPTRPPSPATRRERVGASL
jgi:AcrR family transcriptional regulator